MYWGPAQRPRVSAPSRSQGCISRIFGIDRPLERKVHIFLGIFVALWVCVNIFGAMSRTAHRKTLEEDGHSVNAATSIVSSLFTGRAEHAPHDHNHKHAPKFVRSKGPNEWYNVAGADNSAAPTPAAIPSAIRQIIDAKSSASSTAPSTSGSASTKMPLLSPTPLVGGLPESKSPSSSSSQSSYPPSSSSPSSSSSSLPLLSPSSSTSSTPPTASLLAISGKSEAGASLVDIFTRTLGRSLPDVSSYPPANPNIHAFYYAWYAAKPFDKEWSHWNHEILPHWVSATTARYPRTRYTPPYSVGSDFYPWYPYASRDPAVIALHLHQFRMARIGTLVVSYWGKNSVDGQGHFVTDEVMPTLLNLAHAFGVKVAFHMEPYSGRTASTVRDDIQHVVRLYGKHPGLLRYGSRNLPFVYLYDSYHLSSSQWATVFKAPGKGGSPLLSIRGTADDVFALGLVVERHHSGEIVSAGFDGFYTYFASDGFSHGSTIHNWPSLSTFAKQNKLVFVPSVGPGYSDLRVRPWNGANAKPRTLSNPNVASKLTPERLTSTLKQANFALSSSPSSSPLTSSSTSSAGGRRVPAEWASTRTSPLYYDAYWAGAASVAAEIISITSFNEWHEGTQIELSAMKNTAPRPDQETKFVDPATGRETPWQPPAYLVTDPLTGDYYLKRTGEWVEKLEEDGIIPRMAVSTTTAASLLPLTSPLPSPSSPTSSATPSSSSTATSLAAPTTSAASSSADASSTTSLDDAVLEANTANASAMEPTALN